MLFNEYFPGQNTTMTLMKITNICSLYCALFFSIFFSSLKTFFSSSNIFKPLDNNRVQRILDGGLAAGLNTA